MERLWRVRIRNLYINEDCDLCNCCTKNITRIFWMGKGISSQSCMPDISSIKGYICFDDFPFYYNFNNSSPLNSLMNYKYLFRNMCHSAWCIAHDTSDQSHFTSIWELYKPTYPVHDFSGTSYHMRYIPDNYNAYLSMHSMVGWGQPSKTTV